MSNDSSVINPIQMSEEDFINHDNEGDGLCIGCGHINYNFTEPDAEELPCDDCHQNKVMGYQMALEMEHIQITTED